jgi:hypothetical protein
MGWRFRKSFGRGPFRVNVGKTGVGFSWGIPGLRFGQAADGRMYLSVGIPGTGLSYFQYFSRKRGTTPGGSAANAPQLPNAANTSINEFILNSTTVEPPRVRPGLELIYEGQGLAANRSFLLQGRGRVGRLKAGCEKPEIDLDEVAEHEFVSSLHAELWDDANGEWWVRDLGSKNGTFIRPAAGHGLIQVDGPRKLENEEEIVFGCAYFRVRIA